MLMAGEMLSATIPLAMSAAAVIVGGRLRERRRRRSLNRALHELRRPLQALALSTSDPVPLEPVLDALAELDGAINGSRPRPAPEEIELRHLAESVVERWARTARAQAGRPRLRWRAGRARVLGDRVQLARALDNLVANAIEHGRGPIEVTGSLRRDRLRILVCDGGGRTAHEPPPPVGRGGRVEIVRRHDPRRGHGLEIVREVAAAHGGRFVLRRSPALTLAVLELPIADPVPPEAAA